MKLYVKYMVSLRCIMIVRKELESCGINYSNIELGVVQISTEPTPEQHERFRSRLHNVGLELLDNQKSILVEKIKITIMEMIHHFDNVPCSNYSDYISEKLNYDYTYLSNIFSEVKGITLQQFIILHKIERVKELLLYDELNLTEIAYKLHYSSVSHLSNQFRKITGLSPSFYKQLKEKRKINLGNL